MDKYLNLLISKFRDKSNTEDALYFEKYMKNNFKFLGVRTPVKKEIIKDFYKENGKPLPEKTTDYVKYLWNLPEREFQHLALNIFEKNKTNLKLEDIDLIEYVITHKSWWDTVDGTVSISGEYFKKYPEAKNHTERWIESENFWLQRSALLFQLKYKSDTDKDLLFRYIKKTSHINEFFIRKAIGWALRQYSKYNPDVVKEFVENNELSALSKKEALRIIIKG